MHVQRWSRRVSLPLAASGLCLCLLSGGLSTTAQAEADSRTLYLVRHGFYDTYDDSDPYSGKGLLPLGVAQARSAADRLRALPVELGPLHASTMTRARETAYVMRDILGKDTVHESRLLSECTPPTWREDIMADHGPLDKMEACRAKLDSAFARYFAPAPDGPLHEVIVCHGNVIRYFVTRALKVDTLSWLGMSVGHCSITTIRIDPGGAMKVLGVGDVGHLPPHLQSGTTHAEPVLQAPDR